MSKLPAFITTRKQDGLETDTLTLSLDWETRSTVNLPITGPYVYAMHPDTDIILCAWAFDDMAEPEMWWPGDEVPQRIVDHVRAGGEIRAHNAAFERLMWKYVATPRYGWPEAKLEQFHCTAAEAAAMSLPRSLGQLAAVLKLDAQKDQSGHRLMMQMCKPRKVLDDGSIIWWEDWERKNKLAAYCRQDVRTERAAAKVIRRLDPAEREVYLATERMNDRGVQTDGALIASAIVVSKQGVDEANAKLDEITDGSVAAVTQVAKIKEWLLREHAIKAEKLDKTAVRDLLDEDIPEQARAVIELRAGFGRSSIAKLKTMQATVCDDGRCRGMQMYHGAGTGRWTGKLIQPHNFTRGEIDNVERYIPLVLEANHDKIALMEPPVTVIMSLLRAMLTARAGFELMVSDFAAIEARVLNWLAGQQDMIDLFFKYDAASPQDKPNFDPYRVNAARLWNMPLDEVQKFPHRMTGKFQELGCGFGMGHKKAVESAYTAQYGFLELTLERSKEIVDSYRHTHQKVVEYWNDCNDAAMSAVQNPGAVFKVGKVKFIKAGAYLYIILPSGRPLAYAAPRIAPRKTPWGEMRDSVIFWGVHPITGQWAEMGLYGGLIVENIVQGVARDLLAAATLRLEAKGYTPILLVHDEIVSEVPEGFGSVHEHEQLMSALPEWAAGCPVAAEGWRGFRYRK